MKDKHPYVEKGDFVFFYAGPFSQWYKREFCIPRGGLLDDPPATFNCCEQAMMCRKALLFDDLESFGHIYHTEAPAVQKRLGRMVCRFDSEKWDQVKFEIVKENNLYKFFQHNDLRDILLSTGNKVIAEASPWDAIWGIKMGVDDPNILDTSKWGENLLGKALMAVREDLRTIEKAFGKINWNQDHTDLIESLGMQIVKWELPQFPDSLLSLA